MPRIPEVAAPTATAADSSTRKRTRACLVSDGKVLSPRKVTATQIRSVEHVPRTQSEVQAVNSRAVTGEFVQVPAPTPARITQSPPPCDDANGQARPQSIDREVDQKPAGKHRCHRQRNTLRCSELQLTP